jgi:hypothetical protein
MAKNKEPSAEIIAVEKMAEDIQTAEELYADGMPYDIDRIENQIRFYQDQAGSALLEMGKCFARIKAHEERGRFMMAVENVGMSYRQVQYAMLAERKFSNANTYSHLGDSKLKALSVLDEDEIETLGKGGDMNGITLDDIDRMTNRELRENLREGRKKAKVEKERHTKKVEELACEIKDLTLKFSGADILTAEQKAQKRLDEMTSEYTIALAGVTSALRTARQMVVDAENIEGVNVQQLNQWLNQFDGEI